jgi:class 3 adenylate cyclase
MTEIKKFEFERSRGIIWACDLVKSSKFLNDNESADTLEEFLPRLYWTSVIAVEAAGGQFIKWTGDGFLAWFETPLHRLISEKTSNVFRAAYLMTTLVNITQLETSAANFCASSA